jgi:cytochrome o ubiquinol oxidase subunit II
MGDCLDNNLLGLGPLISRSRSLFMRKGSLHAQIDVLAATGPAGAAYTAPSWLKLSAIPEITVSNPGEPADRTRHSRRLRWLSATTTRRAVIMAPIVLTACEPAVLDTRGVVGNADKTILIDSLAIMLAIVVPTIAATLVFAWWFRASNAGARYLPDWEYSGRVELIVWSIPLLVIMLLGGVAWIGSHDLDPAKPLKSNMPPLEIQGISLDWKWLFVYPSQGVASVNQLVVPTGVPLHFSLTSASVMNALFVAQLGSMIYTMNGMTTQLYLQADEPGTFHGISSHFSGDGFSDMHFDLVAVPAERFAAWIEATRNTGPTLDPASYAALARQSINTRPFTFRAVQPGLFHEIVTQKLPPGPGPQSGRPNRTVSPLTEQ